MECFGPLGNEVVESWSSRALARDAYHELGNTRSEKGWEVGELDRLCAYES